MTETEDLLFQALIASALLLLTGCSAHRQLTIPPMRPGDPMISGGTITGARNLTFFSHDALIDGVSKCEHALCVGGPDTYLMTKDIEVYLTTVDGHETVVMHPAKRRRRWRRPSHDR